MAVIRGLLVTKVNDGIEFANRVSNLLHLYPELVTHAMLNLAGSHDTSAHPSIYASGYASGISNGLLW